MSFPRAGQHIPPRSPTRRGIPRAVSFRTTSASGSPSRERLRAAGLGSDALSAQGRVPASGTPEEGARPPPELDAHLSPAALSGLAPDADAEVARAIVGSAVERRDLEGPRPFDDELLQHRPGGAGAADQAGAKRPIQRAEHV